MSLAAPLCRADAAAGLSDLQGGRFAEAVQAWREAAAGGDATAALYLGAMYDIGEGVGQDYGQALGWYGLPHRAAARPG